MRYFSVTRGVRDGELTKHKSKDNNRQLVDYFKGIILQRHDLVNFEAVFKDYELYYTVGPSAALVTLSCNGMPATISALMSGRDKKGDDVALDAMWRTTQDYYENLGQQTHIVRSDLGISARPLVVTSILPTSVVSHEGSAKSDPAVVAQLELHFACAYFEWVGDRPGESKPGFWKRWFR